jgi:hypothetical protein
MAANSLLYSVSGFPVGISTCGVLSLGGPDGSSDVDDEGDEGDELLQEQRMLQLNIMMRQVRNDFRTFIFAVLLS